MRKTIFACLACLLILAGARSTARAVPAGPQISVAVDGSVTPDLIPDLLAYRLYFQAMAEPSNASAFQLARMRGKLAPLKLSDADFKTMAAALEEFYDAHVALNARLDELHKAGAADAKAMAGLKAESDAVVARTLRRLLRELSAEAADRLVNYVKGEKRNMKILS